MTLQGFVEVMEAVAGSQPAIRTVIRADVYRLNALPSVRYGVFAWQQRMHRVERDRMQLAFHLFYVDRLDLIDGGSPVGNELDVQSVGIRVLANIIRTVAERTGVSVGGYTVEAFNQRFSDLCAGVYATVTFNVPAEWICGVEGADYNEDYNDDYDII